MPPHEAMLPAAALPAAPDPDGLRADEATVVFAERLRFAVVLQRVAAVAVVNRLRVLIPGQVLALSANCAGPRLRSVSAR